MLQNNRRSSVIRCINAHNSHRMPIVKIESCETTTVTVVLFPGRSLIRRYHENYTLRHESTAERLQYSIHKINKRV